MTNNHTGNPKEPKHSLGIDERPAGRGRLWLAILGLLASVVAGVLYLSSGDDAAPRYITAEARRGDLTIKVTATGELKPLNQVEVGTEVSGTIETVEVSHNDRVKRGQILAKLDTEQLEAKRRQTEATLALAKARVREAEATVTETVNKLRRARRLVEKALASKEDFDIAEASYLRAEAALAIAKAQVADNQAQLDESVRVLEKAVIRAPIDGIVLKRQIEPGQTVAASLQTPVLFTLAENLSQMELYVAVDEADVGQVKEGQSAVFTVDAYPDRIFPATIAQVRFAPQTVEGVVTYETILSVDNADLFLRPGMTATADITVNQVKEALLVPNAALRFTPPAPEEPGAGKGGSLLSKLFPRRPERRNPGGGDTPSHSRQQRVWTLQGGVPVAVPVTVGLSDGAMSEVKAGEIGPGMPLAVDMASEVK